MRSFVLIVAIVLGGVRQSEGAIQWKVEDGGNGNFYEQAVTVGGALDSWAQAKAAAEAMTFLGVSGHLVTITSLEEQLFVESFYDGQKSWIGLTDDPAFGGTESFGQANPQVDGWVWVTGEPVVFTNWDTVGEPNNQGGHENFAIMFTDSKFGGWDDQSSQSSAGTFPRFILEFEVGSTAIPEPSTLIIWSLLATLCLSVCRHRRRRPF